ncbi:MAG: 50S ribosomal protein L25/general stress protein Ctc [Bacteroidota bacterium]
MKTVSMSGSLRENVGKRDAKMQRKAGKIPCVLYGGDDQLHFVVDERSIEKILFTPEVCTLSINIEGKEHLSILKDIQYHPVNDKVLHVDFFAINETKPVIISVPIKLTGTAPGILKGGKLIKKFRKLKIKALLNQLPDEIVISIDNMDVGDSIKVADLSREHIEFLDNPSSVIISIALTRAVEETPAPGK